MMVPFSDAYLVSKREPAEPSALVGHRMEATRDQSELSSSCQIEYGAMMSERSEPTSSDDANESNGDTKPFDERDMRFLDFLIDGAVKELMKHHAQVEIVRRKPE